MHMRVPNGTLPENERSDKYGLTQSLALEPAAQLF